MKIRDLKEILKRNKIDFESFNTGVAFLRDDIDKISKEDHDLFFSHGLLKSNIYANGVNLITIQDPALFNRPDLQEVNKWEDSIEYVYVAKREYDSLVEANKFQTKQLRELPGAEVILRTENGIDFLTYQTLENDIKTRLSDLRDQYYALQYEYNKLYRDFQDGIEEGVVKVKKEDEGMVMIAVKEARKDTLHLSDIGNMTPAPKAPEEEVKEKPSTRSWRFWGLQK